MIVFCCLNGGLLLLLIKFGQLRQNVDKCCIAILISVERLNSDVDEC